MQKPGPILGEAGLQCRAPQHTELVTRAKFVGESRNQAQGELNLLQRAPQHHVGGDRTSGMDPKEADVRAEPAMVSTTGRNRVPGRITFAQVLRSVQGEPSLLR
jgi:hypothetical protein